MLPPFLYQKSVTFTSESNICKTKYRLMCNCWKNKARQQQQANVNAAANIISVPAAVSPQPAPPKKTSSPNYKIIGGRWRRVA